MTDTTGVNPWWRVPIARWAAFRSAREEQVFLVLTLLIGALVGLVVVAFILLTERAGAHLYPAGSTPWRRLLVPVVGSLAMGYLLYRYFPDARGSGVPQTKAALFAREGRITLSTVFGKFFCTSATLASGIPLGREGPAVQVGGGIASVLGRALGLRPEKVKSLIPVGAAAAIAAAFNTPLAAVLFALEEVMSDLHAPILGSVVLASATSWGVMRLVLGNDPLFQVPQYQLVNPWELVIYGFLGIAGGLVSAAFSQLLLRTRARFQRFPRKTVWFQPVAGGIVGRRDGLVCAASPGRGLQVCGGRIKRTDGAEADGSAAGAEAGRHGNQLWLWKRRRHIWTELVPGSDARRRDRKRGATFFPWLRSYARRLRAGGHGNGFRGHRSRTDDVGGDDL